VTNFSAVLVIIFFLPAVSTPALANASFNSSAVNLPFDLAKASLTTISAYFSVILAS